MEKGGTVAPGAGAEAAPADGGEKERPESAFGGVGGVEVAFFEKPGKELLREIIGYVLGIASAAEEGVDRLAILHANPLERLASQ